MFDSPYQYVNLLEWFFGLIYTLNQALHLSYNVMDEYYTLNNQLLGTKFFK